MRCSLISSCEEEKIAYAEGSVTSVSGAAGVATVDAVDPQPVAAAVAGDGQVAPAGTDLHAVHEVDVVEPAGGVVRAGASGAATACTSRASRS